MGALKTTRIYYLIVLEDTSMKSRCQLSHMPSEACRGDSFIVTSRFQCLLAVPTIPPLADTLLQSLPLITWPSFLRYLHIIFPLCFTSYICAPVIYPLLGHSPLSKYSENLNQVLFHTPLFFTAVLVSTVIWIIQHQPLTQPSHHQ